MTHWQAIVDYKLNEQIEDACKKGEIPARVWHLEDHITGPKLSLRMTIDAIDLIALAKQLEEEIRKLKGVLGDSDPISVRLLANGLPEQVPQLVGLADIAKMLRVSRQRAKQLADNNRNFPRPLAYTPTVGNMYAQYEIRSWIEDRNQALGRTILGRNDFPIQPVIPRSQSKVPPAWLASMTEK